MHRCLTINEILAIIVRDLLSPYSHQDDRRNLTAMALTCKTFYEPAMRESWHTVEDISRLAHTLPSDAVVFADPVVKGGVSIKPWVCPFRKCGYNLSRICY